MRWPPSADRDSRAWRTETWPAWNKDRPSTDKNLCQVHQALCPQIEKAVQYRWRPWGQSLIDNFLESNYSDVDKSSLCLMPSYYPGSPSSSSWMFLLGTGEIHFCPWCCEIFQWHGLFSLCVLSTWWACQPVPMGLLVILLMVSSPLFSFFFPKLYVICSLPWFGMWLSFVFQLYFLALFSKMFLQFYIPAIILHLKIFCFYIFNF